MKLNLYAVLDEKAQAFGSMFFRKRHEEAKRYFGDAVIDPKTILHQHPQDFSLYYLGVLNDETGLVTAVTPIEFVARASEFKSNFEVKSEIDLVNGTPESPRLKNPQEVGR